MTVRISHWKNTLVGGSQGIPQRSQQTTDLTQETYGGVGVVKGCIWVGTKERGRETDRQTWYVWLWETYKDHITHEHSEHVPHLAAVMTWLLALNCWRQQAWGAAASWQWHCYKTEIIMYQYEDNHYIIFWWAQTQTCLNNLKQINNWNNPYV